MFKKSINNLYLNFKNYFVEWFLLIFGLVVIAVFVSYTLLIEYNEITKKEENRLSTQARIINDNISLQLDSLNETLLNIRNKVEQDGLKDLKDISEQLKLYIKILPIARTFAIINKNGEVLASSREEVLNFNLKDREYFQTVKNNPSRDKLFICEPYKTLLGSWTISLSLMFSDSKNEFAGIILATIDPEKLMNLLNSVFYAKDMRSSIIYGDGTLFLTTPSYNEILGKNINISEALFNKHVTSNKVLNVINGLSHIPNENRLIAFHTIFLEKLNMTKPLYVAVSRDIEVLYSNFKEEVILIGSLYLILVFISVPTLYFLQKKRYFLKLSQIKAENDLKRRLESFAYIDGLTEISNRRHFDQVFDQEWRYGVRNEKLLSLILIDVDYFKLYNDFYGHQAGDECLKTVAQTLKHNLFRSHDLVARYGGEEFICILPNTNLENAREKAEKLRLEIEKLEIPHEKSLVKNSVTISLGVSTTLPKNDLKAENLIKKADEALYNSKRDGRNRVSTTILI